MRPMDADGFFCGLDHQKEPTDNDYASYPYLYYANIDTQFWIPYGVCVSKCPTSEEDEIDCIPTSIVDLHGGCDSFYKYRSVKFLDRLCIPVYTDLPDSIKSNYDNMVGEIGVDDLHMYARDIENCPYVYLACIVSTFLLIFIYNWMLRCFAETLAWIAIIVVGVGLFGLGWLVKDYADVNYPEGDTTQKWLNIAAYAVWVVNVIYILLVCCLYYSIKISIKVLKTSAKVIMNNMRMIIVPLLGIAVIICWFAAFTYGLLYLMSCGDIVLKENALLTYYSYEWTDQQKYMMWYTAFLFFWITAFIVAATQYILIVAVVSWYFTENAETRGNFSLLRGYWWSIRYNIGSLLFGSFIIAVIWMIRTVFEYINRKI